MGQLKSVKNRINGYASNVHSHLWPPLAKNGRTGAILSLPYRAQSVQNSAYFYQRFLLHLHWKLNENVPIECIAQKLFCYQVIPRGTFWAEERRVSNLCLSRAKDHVYLNFFYTGDRSLNKACAKLNRSVLNYALLPLLNEQANRQG